MIEKSVLPLREFVYFDREKVEDFVSALLGGLPNEQKETTATKPSQIGGSLGLGSTKVNLKKGFKEITREELLKATYKILQGGKYISVSFSDELLLSLDRDVEQLPHETLSDREYQVMLMIAVGKTRKAIAENLFLSVKTISTYRTRILEKMGLKSNADLTTYASKHKLII